MALDINRLRRIDDFHKLLDSKKQLRILQFEEIVSIPTHSEKVTTLSTLANTLGLENLSFAMKLAGYSEEVIEHVVIPEPEPVENSSR